MPARAAIMSDIGRLVHAGGSVAALGASAVATVTATGMDETGRAVAVGIGSIVVAASPLITRALAEFGAMVRLWFEDRKDARAVAAAEKQRQFQLQLDEAHWRAAEAEREMARIRVDVTANTARSGALAGGLDALRGKLQENGLLPLPPYLSVEPGVNWPWLLIVEDDPRGADVLNRLMIGYGYRSAHVATAAEAIERIRADHPAYVILDLKLADGDGLPVLEMVRREGIPSVVVVLTGATDPARLAAVEALQPAAILPKPLDLDDLLRVIRSGSSDDHPAYVGGPP